ncbi:MAG: hypothetical protein IH621_09830, partial [Krumholzibacteria bacterium]|nr:hypothetical protein [Candidatus Krumholzibacteria bacterium]
AWADETGAAAWDGRDDRGRPAPAGVYLVHLQAGNEETRQRLVLLR